MHDPALLPADMGDHHHIIRLAAGTLDCAVAQSMRHDMLSCSNRVILSVAHLTSPGAQQGRAHLHDQVRAPAVREAQAGRCHAEVLVATSKVEARGSRHSRQGRIRHHPPATCRVTVAEAVW